MPLSSLNVSAFACGDPPAQNHRRKLLSGASAASLILVASVAFVAPARRMSRLLFDMIAATLCSLSRDSRRVGRQWAMTNRIANAKRFVIAMFALALYAFGGIFIPAFTAHAHHHPSHSCHMAIHEMDAAGDRGARSPDQLGASSSTHGTAARHAGGGHAPAGPDCRLACSMALASLAEPVFAFREAVAFPFEPWEQDADGLAPGRLSRPPKSPLA